MVMAKASMFLYSPISPFLDHSFISISWVASSASSLDTNSRFASRYNLSLKGITTFKNSDCSIGCLSCFRSQLWTYTIMTTHIEFCYKIFAVCQLVPILQVQIVGYSHKSLLLRNCWQEFW